LAKDRYGNPEQMWLILKF